MWKGPSSMTDYFPSLSSDDTSLTYYLHLNFYARFEVIGSQQAKTAEADVNGWMGAPFTPITYHYVLNN